MAVLVVLGGPVMWLVAVTAGVLADHRLVMGSLVGRRLTATGVVLVVAAGAVPVATRITMEALAAAVSGARVAMLKIPAWPEVVRAL